MYLARFCSYDSEIKMFLCIELKQRQTGVSHLIFSFVIKIYFRGTNLNNSFVLLRPSLFIYFFFLNLCLA